MIREVKFSQSLTTYIDLARVKRASASAIWDSSSRLENVAVMDPNPSASLPQVGLLDSPLLLRRSFYRISCLRPFNIP